MRKQWKRISTVLLAVCLLSSGYACSSKEANSGPSRAPSATFQNGLQVGENYATEYTSLFDGDEILDISLTLQEAYWNEMLAAPEQEQYYSATFALGSETVAQVGFRTSGNTDLSGLPDAAQNRYSFKVKFDKYVDKQKFLKLDEMSLINLNRDPSYMREFLAYKACRLVGLPAPLASFARVTVNGTYQGLYLALEAVDDAFLKRVYGNNDGNLYKAQEGADLTGELCMQYLDQKNGSDRSKNDLQELIRILNAMPDGQKGDIERILDVNSVLQYAAVCAGVGAFTSYFGKNAENFYLACNGGRFTVIPWDMKSAFGAANQDNGVTSGLDPYTPVFRTTLAERPLIGKLLAVEEYRNTYTEYLKRVCTFLEGIGTEVDTLDALIGEAVAADTTAFYGGEQYEIAIGKADAAGNTTGTLPLTEYASLRAAYLRSQL